MVDDLVLPEGSRVPYAERKAQLERGRFISVRNLANLVYKKPDGNPLMTYHETLEDRDKVRQVILAHEMSLGLVVPDGTEGQVAAAPAATTTATVPQMQPAQAAPVQQGAPQMSQQFMPPAAPAGFTPAPAAPMQAPMQQQAMPQQPQMQQAAPPASAAQAAGQPGGEPPAPSGRGRRRGAGAAVAPPPAAPPAAPQQQMMPQGAAPGFQPQQVAPQGFAPQGPGPQGFGAPQGFAPQGVPGGFAPQAQFPGQPAPQAQAPMQAPPMQQQAAPAPAASVDLTPVLQRIDALGGSLNSLAEEMGKQFGGVLQQLQATQQALAESVRMNQELLTVMHHLYFQFPQLAELVQKQGGAADLDAFRKYVGAYLPAGR